MKCPICYFENTYNVNVCEKCGADLRASLNPQQAAYNNPNPGNREQNRFLAWAGRQFSSFFSCVMYIIFLIFFILIILTILAFQCRLNIPIPPRWDFLPNSVINYWEWADDWQMSRCPDLEEGNYILGDEPLPVFDEEGEIITPPTACAGGTITFSPWNAATGSTFDISLDGFSANEILNACWYYPSGSLVNCTDLEVDENGHRDTVYWSESDEPTGIYRMEVDGECATVSTEWTID